MSHFEFRFFLPLSFTDELKFAKKVATKTNITAPDWF